MKPKENSAFSLVAVIIGMVMLMVITPRVPVCLFSEHEDGFTVRNGR